MTTTTAKPIVWFDEIGKEDIPLVGGKGANLGELTRAGIPVPPGFVVTADSYFRFLEASGIKPRITSLLQNLDHRNTSALNAASEAIKNLILEAPMPQGLRRDIVQAYERLGGGLVAVRSSATAEDLPEASFAGQQATFLNIHEPGAVVKAVQACWASLFEARAIFYRAENRFEHMKVGIAVPVQRMVQSRRSGVMFTCEPVTSDTSKITIEAILGLGEAIVSGSVSPDHYLVDKRSLRILEKEIGDQQRQLIHSPNGRDTLHTNEWVDLTPDQRVNQKLTDQEIIDLARLGRSVEEHYGTVQDIEWAEEEGRFYLVQSRPVTTLKAAEEAEELAETAPVLLSGAPAGPGVDAGPVRIILDPSEIDRVQPGDVLVAEMTTPDFVPAMKRAVAIVTDHGGRTCHAAIVSRELGIACVVGAKTATKDLREDQVITVDGSHGKVYDGRAETTLAWGIAEKERRSRASTLKTRTKIYVNLAEPELAEVVAKRNVDGIGLLRAEFIVAQIGEHPHYAIDNGQAEQFISKLASGIETFARAFHPRPVVYRMTDFKTNEYANLLGGDKYEPHEENPMIGFRGASRYIRDREVVALEVEAIKRVREKYPNLWVMIPFVRTPEELAGVRDLLAELGLERSETFKLWMMTEVPSNVLLLDKFIDVGIDGISIGSNDLTQLVLGIDRDNETFAEEFDERNDAVMAALERLVRGGTGRGITVSICGQAPSVFQELTERLVEWGITSVSVSPDAIDVTREYVAKAEAKLVSMAHA